MLFRSNGEVRELRSIKNRMGVEAEALGFRIVRQDGEEDAGWLDFDVQVEQKFKMPTLVEMGLENVHTMLKILAGHFYTRGAIEEMLAEEFGLPAKRTLDDIFARLGQMEGIRVEVHQQNKKYYGYFGEPGEELTKWEEVSEEDPGEEQPADPLGLIMESLKQRVWQKALTQARRETGKEGEGSLNDEC